MKSRRRSRARLTRAERNAFFSDAGRFTPYVATQAPGDTRFVVRSSDRNVGASLYEKRGRREMRVIRGTVNLLRALAGDEAVAGKTFVDVGANIGTSVVTAVKAYGFGSGVALEPEDDNYLTLRLNILLNDLEGDIATHRVAVSDQTGTASLIVTPEQSGRHRLVSGGPGVEIPRSRAIEVPMVSLDDLVADDKLAPEEVGLLWIDAQGQEAHILAGARTLTDPGTPLVFEWDPLSFDTSEEHAQVVELLRGAYTHFMDLRPNADGTGPAYELRPIDDFGEFAASFLEPDRTGQRFTDLLALRLDGDSEIPTDVSSIVRRGHQNGR